MGFMLASHKNGRHMCAPVFCVQANWAIAISCASARLAAHRLGQFHPSRPPQTHPPMPGAPPPLPSRHAAQDDVVQRRVAGHAVLPHPGVLQDLVGGGAPRGAGLQHALHAVLGIVRDVGPGVGTQVQVALRCVCVEGV